MSQDSAASARALLSVNASQAGAYITAHNSDCELTTSHARGKATRHKVTGPISLNRAVALGMFDEKDQTLEEVGNTKASKTPQTNKPPRHNKAKSKKVPAARAKGPPTDARRRDDYNRKLDSLSKTKALPPNLEQLVYSSRLVSNQKWKYLAIQTTDDEIDPEYPIRRTTYYEHLRIVEFLAMMCSEYHHAFEEAEDQSYTLDTEDFEDELSSFAADVVELGEEAAAAEETDIKIVEEERPGTKELLACDGIRVEDAYEEDMSDEDDDVGDDDLSRFDSDEDDDEMAGQKSAAVDVTVAAKCSAPMVKKDEGDGAANST
jgi:hypothetical protein